MRWIHWIYGAIRASAIRAGYGLIVLLAMAGCVSDSLYMPADTDWVKRGANPADRAYAMLDCQSQFGLAFDGLRGTVSLRRTQDPARFRICMEADGWALPH